MSRARRVRVSVLNNIDFDKAVQEHANMLGVPPKLLRSPGPWDWSGQADTREPHRVFTLTGGTQRVVAVVGDRDEARRDGWSARNGADARLIAAAPELLAALEALSERFVGRSQADYDLWTAATAAIAKARGQ